MNRVLEVMVACVKTVFLSTVFATWVAEKAKKRNEKVPTSSPHAATKWPLKLGGRKPKKGRRFDFSDMVRCLSEGWTSSCISPVWRGSRSAAIARLKKGSKISGDGKLAEKEMIMGDSSRF